MRDVWQDIRSERERQQALWPGQTCREMAQQGRHQECLAILAEEVGEVARALNEHQYQGAPIAHLRTELVQVAAVACAWLEGLGCDPTLQPMPPVAPALQLHALLIAQGQLAVVLATDCGCCPLTAELGDALRRVAAIAAGWARMLGGGAL